MLFRLSWARLAGLSILWLLVVPLLTLLYLRLTLPKFFSGEVGLDLYYVLTDSWLAAWVGVPLLAWATWLGQRLIARLPRNR